ncbi:hemerythrin domain-containing protein, partial [Acinetobacter haemolyticus]|uniref:hemerythrin domain-containing protein n=1 Tax=Acinetobacter haemolyticus TaxID=29430 RepID=UPI00035E67A1
MGMKWSVDYNTGIEVIDEQHRRILDYINQIDELKHCNDRVKIKEVLNNIIDYTQSHFTFEERANSNMRCDSLKSLMIIN